MKTTTHSLRNIERMAQGVRKSSDSTPVEKRGKLDKMRELE